MSFDTEKENQIGKTCLQNSFYFGGGLSCGKIIDADGQKGR